jgi:hypothetical protein
MNQKYLEAESALQVKAGEVITMHGRQCVSVRGRSTIFRINGNTSTFTLAPESDQVMLEEVDGKSGQVQKRAVRMGEALVSALEVLTSQA